MVIYAAYLTWFGPGYVQSFWLKLAKKHLSPNSSIVTKTILTETKLWSSRDCIRTEKEPSVWGCQDQGRARPYWARVPQGMTLNKIWNLENMETIVSAKIDLKHLQSHENTHRRQIKMNLSPLLLPCILEPDQYLG